MMKRVMIIGSPGTGKSTFAKQLSAKTNLPLIHLDFYYHDKAENYFEDKEAWKARVDELTAQPTWIIDGNYGRTMAERMKRADTIFYFDMPRRIALKGVLKRRFKREKRTDMPKGWKNEAGLDFILKVWKFRNNYAADTEELLRRNEDKQVIRFQNHIDVAKYLQNL